MDFDDELYQEIVLDHARRPRNRGTLPDATVCEHGENPSCGDEVFIALKICGEEIEDARFSGDGCAICTASASLMTQALKRCPRERACALFKQFQRLLEADEKALADAKLAEQKQLGELAALAGVRRFPQRVSCAMLPWQALRQALKIAFPKTESESK